MRYAWIIVVAVLGSSSVALAQDGGPDWANKSGHFGVGADTTLGGTSGVSLRYQISQLLGLQAAFGFGLNIDDPDEDGIDTQNVITFRGGLYASFTVTDFDRVSLAPIIGVDLDIVSDSNDDDAIVDFAAAAGLQLEWFASRGLSFFLQTGLRIDLIADDDNAVITGMDFPDDSSGVMFELAADLFGTMGFTAWFE
jgi:hypothetical protein